MLDYNSPGLGGRVSRFRFNGTVKHPINLLISNRRSHLCAMARRIEVAGGQALTGAQGLVRTLRPVIEPSLVAMLDRCLFSGENRQQLLRPPVAPAALHAGAVPSLLEIEVDVEHFNEKELSVRVINRNLIVRGSHNQRQEKGANQCVAAREFSSSYRLPDNVDADTISCDMSSDNYLYISAPRVTKHRAVPIRMTGMKRRRSNATLARSNMPEHLMNAAERQDDDANVIDRSVMNADYLQCNGANADTAAPPRDESGANAPSGGAAPQPGAAGPGAALLARELSAEGKPPAPNANADVEPAVSSSDISGPM